MGSGVRAQFRRTRRLFRSPAAADCQDDTKLAGPGSASELEASRLQGSGDSHGTIRAAQDRNGGALGALLHPQDDRMALGPRADDSARPLREELRRGARPHAAAAGDRSPPRAGACAAGGGWLELQASRDGSVKVICDGPPSADCSATLMGLVSKLALAQVPVTRIGQGSKVVLELKLTDEARPSRII